MITFVKDKCFGLVTIGQERTTTVGHEGEILEILAPTIQNFFFLAPLCRGKGTAGHQNCSILIVTDTDMTAKRTFEVGVQVKLFIVL